MQKQNTPMIDADWLLGPMPPSRSSLLLRIRQRVVAVFTVCLVCVLFVLVIPSASRWWVRDQLLQQFHSEGNSSEQELAIISLAEMLPESSHQLVEALICANPKASQVAYQALETYAQYLLAEQSEDRKSSGIAHILDTIDQSIAKLSKERKHPAIALTKRLEANLQKKPFNGSSVLTKMCQQLLHNEPDIDFANPSLEETQLAMSTKSGSTVAIDRPIKALLADSAVIHPSLVQSQIPSVSAITPETTLNIPSSDITRDRLTASNSAIDLQDNATPTRLDLESNAPVFKSPRSHLPGSVRIETASLLSTPDKKPIEFLSEESSGVATAEITLSRTQMLQNKIPDEPMESPAEEVVGIDRQKTEDLIALLGSVRAKVASAALYELERRGMTATQLEIAVDLARGTSEARLGALERLIHQEDFDPTPWLGWIAADRDRTVRYRAVSMLGSLNSNASRTKLRLLLARERDDEITRHIQQILLSGSKTSAVRTTSQRTTRP